MRNLIAAAAVVTLAAYCYVGCASASTTADVCDLYCQCLSCAGDTTTHGGVGMKGCLTLWQGDQKAAESAGCGSQFQDELDCVANRTTCGYFLGDDDECTKESSAVLTCENK